MQKSDECNIKRNGTVEILALKLSMSAKEADKKTIKEQAGIGSGSTPH
jgi:hypothetical protein